MKETQVTMLSLVTTNDLVPEDHPIRQTKPMIFEIIKGRFDTGRTAQPYPLQTLLQLLEKGMPKKPTAVSPSIAGVMANV